MYKLIFRKPLRGFFLFLLLTVCLSGLSLIKMPSVEIPLPVYILGSLSVFLVLSFVIYSKASIAQTLQISLSGVFITAVSLTCIYFADSYLNLSEIVLKPDFVICTHPLLAGGSPILSFIVIIFSAKLQEIKTKQALPDKTEENTTEPDNPPSPAATDNSPAPNREGFSEMETVKFDFTQKQDEKKFESNEQTPAGSYEELYPEKSSYTKEEKEEVPDFEEIPQNNLRESENTLLAEDTAGIIPETGEQEKYPDNIEFIPTNIRLMETSAVKETEAKGRIASIGKLLMNNREIENLIETNESVEESVINTRTNVISSISGEKIYNKFSDIKKRFEHIKEVALIDKGGFILANDFEDKQKAQMTGALVSGAYHTLQNYVAQLALAVPVRIFFETANTNSLIVKTKDEILFSTWDKEFKHIEYGPVNELIESKDFSEAGIKFFADLIKIDELIVVDIEGNIVSSLGTSADPEKFAAVSLAIFENLKVFLMNVQLVKLSKIIVFTPEKVLTIAKTNDKIVSFLNPQGEYPKISEELLKMEEIY